jgi:hypothetical protein
MHVVLTVLLSVALGYVLFMAATLVVSALAIRQTIRKHRESLGYDS